MKRRRRSAAANFIVRDNSAGARLFLLRERIRAGAPAIKPLTRDEARRMPATFAKLPELARGDAADKRSRDEAEPPRRLSSRLDSSMLTARRFPPPWTIEERTTPASSSATTPARRSAISIYDEPGLAFGGCPLIGNCGHRLLFERDGSVANDPKRSWNRLAFPVLRAPPRSPPTDFLPLAASGAPAS